MEIYVVHLTGMGDTQICVVDKEVFDWVYSRWPFGNQSSGNEPLPGSLAVPDGNSAPITRGSYANDRALAVSSNIRGYDLVYFELAKFVADVVTNKDTIEGTYVGHVY